MLISLASGKSPAAEPYIQKTTPSIDDVPMTYRDTAHAFSHVSGVENLEHPVKRHSRGSKGVKHTVEHTDPLNSKRKIKMDYEV